MKFRLLLVLNYLSKIIRSPARMVLTLVGLVLSVVMLLTGLIFSETYMKSKTKQTDLYKKYSIVEVVGNYDYELYSDISRKAGNTFMEIIGGGSYEVGTVKHEDRRIKICITEVQTDMVLPCLNMTYPESDRYEAKLLAGRNIVEQDVLDKNPVVVIKDSMAKLLFGDSNPLGQHLVFPAYFLNEEIEELESIYYDFEIIGVVEDYRDADDYFYDIEDQENVSSSITIPAYIPLSLNIKKSFDDTPLMRITSFCNVDTYNQTFSSIKSLVNSQMNGYYQVNSYYSIHWDLMREMETVREVIFMIVIVMFVISGICISNTMFFSVKERINEIGIRKSIGADNGHILRQFIFEGIFYGVVGSVLGIIICMIVDPILFLLLIKNEIWQPGIGLHMPAEIFTLAICVSILISTVASVVPAVYASRVKIADAIRYD